MQSAQTTLVHLKRPLAAIVAIPQRCDFTVFMDKSWSRRNEAMVEASFALFIWLLSGRKYRNCAFSQRK